MRASAGRVIVPAQSSFAASKELHRSWLQNGLTLGLFKVIFGLVAFAFTLWPAIAAAQSSPAITAAQKPVWCAYNNSSTSSATCAYGSSNSAGDILFAFQACQSTSATIGTPTDTAGNSWLPVNSPLVNSGDTTTTQVFYVQNAKKGANTVTYSSSKKTFCALVIWELTNGIAGAWTLDQVQYNLNSGTNNSTLTSNASQVLSQPNELVIGVGGEGGGPNNTFTAGTGFTIPSGGVSDVSTVSYAVESLQSSSIAAQTATMTMGSSANWEMYVATFVPPPATGTPVITSLSPSGGPVGTVVTINGNNFGSSQATTSTVTFNGVAATPISWSNGSIQVAVPSGATTGYVAITVSGSASNGVKFAVEGPIVSAQTPVWCSYNSNAESGTCAYRASNSAGNILFGFEVCQSTTATLETPTDTAGNSWLPMNIALVNKADTTTSQLFYVQDAKSGPNVVTYSSSKKAFCGFLIWELTDGVAGSWKLDQFSSADDSGTNTTALSSGATGTLAQPNELVIGLGGSGFNSGLNLTAGTGFTIAGDGTSEVPSVSYAVEWLPSSSTSPQTATMTISPASDWEMYVATFEPPPVPVTITSISPEVDPVGAVVTVNGASFGSSQGQSTITFGGVPASPTLWSNNQITVPVPAGAAGGSYLVVVTTAQGASNAVAFTVQPSITGLSTGSGMAGTSVTITGSGFGSSQGSSTITVNGVSASASSWSPTSITASVPTAATGGSGTVVVTVGGVSSSGAAFTVVPNIISLSPSAAIIGSTVTITGTGFGATPGTVAFNGTSASPAGWTSGSITVSVPSGATTGSVVVTVNGISSSGASFTVAPNIVSVSPSSGAVGTAVTITGTGFGSSPGSVTFNRTVATPTSWSTGLITAPVPAGATTGNVVVTASGTASNAVVFTVQALGFVATAGQMEAARYGQTATQLSNGQILIAGGINSSGVLSEAELYTLSSQTFAAAANPMNVPRWLHTATLLNDGTVLIAGGSSLSNETTLNSAEIYSPTTGTFTLLPNNLNTARVGHTATLLSNGQVLIVGGYDPNTGIISDSELYDPVAQVFIDLGNTNTPRFHHAATLLQNGQVLITGGETDPTPDSAYNTAEIFNPQTWTFTSLAVNMVSSREGHAATLLNDGTVLITGGDDPPAGSLNTAEIYHATANTFTAVSAAMTSPRIFHDAVLLNGGQVLLSGGENDSNGTSTALNTAELYNPTTQTFTATPGAMTSVREHQTATLLNDGTVLEDGGTDGTNIFNTAEIYTASQLTGLTSIAISPASPSVPLGSQQLLVATGTFNGGSTQVLSSVLWSSSSSSISTVSGDASDSGYVTTIAQGTVTITATAAGVSGSTLVTVRAPTLVSITISPQTLAMPLGTTQQFDAVGTYSDGSTQDITSTATWTSSSASATVNSTGLVTAAALGTSTIQVSSGSQSSSTTVTVGSPALVSLAVTPATAVLAAGQSQQFQATGTYTDGSTQNLTSSARWYAVPQASASVNSAGLVTPNTQGSISITASYGGYDGVASLTVGSPNLVSISVSPSTASIPVGANQQFVAVGSYTDGSTQDLTSSATWTSSSGRAASISSTGFATALAGGNTTISASSGSVTGSATLTVSTGTLALNTSRYQHNATLLNNGSVLLAGGVTCPSAGSCTYLNSAELYNPSSGTITSTGSMATARSAPAVLLGTGNVLIAGGYSCNSAGACASLQSAEIYNPAAGTFSSAGNMTVARDSQTLTLLNSGQVLIAGGETCSSSTSCTTLNTAELYNPVAGTFTATGNLNNARFNANAAALGSGQVLIAGGFNGTSYPAAGELYDPVAATFSVTGSLNTPRASATATLLNNGQVMIAGGSTCSSPGCPTAITELYDGVSSFYYPTYPTGNMNVARLDQTATLLTNGQVLFAGGYDACASSCISDATTEVFDPVAFTFTSSQGLSTGRSQHTATSLTDGSVLIVGGINNGVTLSSTDSYEPSSPALPGLASMTISPSDPPMAPGTTLSLTAAGLDSNGNFLNSQAPLQSVIWTSSSPSVATVSNAAGSAGIVNALSSGTTTITATDGTIAASAQVTVTAALISITVTPSNPTVAIGSTQETQLTATGNYADGSTQNLTPYVSWASSNSSVATVIAISGYPPVIAPAAAGSANLTATYGGVTGSTTVTVTTAPLAPVPPAITAVSPTSGAAGTQVTIAGSGFGPTQGGGMVWLGTNLGSVVSWSDSQVVATVSTGSSSGVAQIQQSNGASNSVPFTINTAQITSVSPNNGLPGTQVTISGSGFGAAQGNGNVWLGTVPAIVDSWSNGQIIATVATGAATGNAMVLQNGVMSNAVPFTINLPQITGITPNSGVAGTAVTINGSGFGASQGSGNVWIGSTYGSVIGWSNTQIVASVASNAVSGVVKVQQNGTWSNAVTFTVPTNSSGGTSVTLVPDAINIVVGGTQPIEAMNSSGQSVTGLTWTSSNTAVATLSTDDPPIITAVAPGNTTITAGNASADVTVWTGPTLPTGTVIWSNPGDGSGVTTIVPAVPSSTGVADVFAMNRSGNVQAITSNGTVAWTANVCPYGYCMPGSGGSNTVIPDFQGGLTLVANYGSSVQKLDGMTGQPYPAYTYTTPYPSFVRVHPDGTIITEDNNAIIGINPTTGQVAFDPPMEQSEYSLSTNNPVCVYYANGTSFEPALVGTPIIAGDGYTYVPYEYYVSSNSFDCTEETTAGTGHTAVHSRIMRVGTDGSSQEELVGDWSADDSWYVPPVPDPACPSDICSSSSGAVPNNYNSGSPLGYLITNADQGVLYSWSVCFENSDLSCTPQYYLTTISSAGVSTVQVAMVLEQTTPVQPILQRADGSYVGTVSSTVGSFMIAFTPSGQTLWTVPNDTPQIATSDIGVIGASGTTYDQNGNVDGQLASLPIQAWSGNVYSDQGGPAAQILSGCTFDAGTELSSSSDSTPCLTPSFEADAGPGPGPPDTAAVNIAVQKQVQTSDGTENLPLDGIAFNRAENVLITLPNATSRLTLTLSLVSTGTNPVTPTTKATFAHNTTSTTVTLKKVKGVVQGVVQILGQAPSDKAGDVTLVATGSDGNSYGSQSFTVVSVLVTANTGTMQQNDSASGIYNKLTRPQTQPAPLGPVLASMVENGPLIQCGIGIEYVGQVTPKDYKGRITLRRYAISYLYVWNISKPSGATLQNTPSLHTDNSIDALVSTTVNNGFVYDIDVPGPTITDLAATSANSYRANYTEFAQLGNWVQTSIVGKTGSLEDVLASPETASLPINSYAAASCNVSATGGPQFNTTYQSNNDNTGGNGCTQTTPAGGTASCN